jgi:diaminopimelate decarboxylase
VQEFSYDGDLLQCEETSLREVARNFGTPLYVYSTHSIIDHCRNIERAFNSNDHLTCYAVKANSNRAILRIIRQEGFGADVNSKGELYLALESGFPPNKITFSGVGKTDDEIAYALRHDILAFNVESREEVEILNSIAGQLGKVGRILVRVNLDLDPGGHAYVSTSVRQSKFGIGLRDVAGLLKWAQSLPHIEVRGIHSHIGSQIIESETFISAANALARLIDDVRREGVPVRELDFGGGFGVQYRGYVKHPKLPDEEPEALNISAATLVRTVVPLLNQTRCSISVQPGRSIVAHSGVLLTRVLYRKEADDKVFIVVDAGMNDLLRPSLYDSYHQIVPLHVTGSAYEHVDVVGPLCESGDFFARNRLMPKVQRGEYLALMCAGAYGYVLSSNYNARPRPAEVLVDGDVCTVIRERERIEDL